MRILIDAGHPAHVHYFKNFTRIMSEAGHEFYFTVRDKESAIDLIEELGFPYYKRGKGGKHILSKLLQLPYIDAKIVRQAVAFRPDLFLSFASPYAAHAAWLMKKPHITFDDTEHAVWAHALYRPFSDVVLSPSCYLGEVSTKQKLFNSYMELCYLHPDYFEPDESIFDTLKLGRNERYVVLRFVSWDANHDVGQKGFTEQDKISLVHELSASHKVFISSEAELPNSLKQYRLNIHPSQFHDVLNFADLYIGEGSTTATECAVLGTPAIYVNSLVVGNCAELEQRYGLVFQLNDVSDVLLKARSLLSGENRRDLFQERRSMMLKDKTDPTAFMVWFVENWPDSNGMMADQQIPRFKLNKHEK